MFDPQKFLEAQDGQDAFLTAAAELRRGRKQSHWMWFVFPQIAGLGRSDMARRYALADLSEAVAYAEHPVLGRRMVDLSVLLLELPVSDPVEIFGAVDAQKLRSSMTLFAQARPQEAVFEQVLAKFFRGVPDPGTVQILDVGPPSVP